MIDMQIPQPTDTPTTEAAAHQKDPPHWPEYQFHDPVWLTWWLESLYPLPPHQQAEIAIRLQSTVYAPRAQEVLSEFLDHLRIRFGVHMTALNGDGEVDTQGVQPTRALWEKVMERLLISFKPILWLSALAIGGWIFGLAAR